MIQLDDNIFYTNLFVLLLGSLLYVILHRVKRNLARKSIFLWVLLVISPWIYDTVTGNSITSSRPADIDLSAVDWIVVRTMMLGIGASGLWLLCLNTKNNTKPKTSNVYILPFWARFKEHYLCMAVTAFLMVLSYYFFGSHFLFYVPLLFIFGCFGYIFFRHLRAARLDDPNNNRYVFLTRYQFSSYLDLNAIKQKGEFSLWEIVKIDLLKEHAEDTESFLHGNDLRLHCWSLIVEGGQDSPDEKVMPYNLDGLKIKGKRAIII